MSVRIIKLITIFFFILILSSCQSDNSNQTTPLEVDIISDQIKPEQINIGSIAARPSRRNAILLATKQINESGGILNKQLNAVTSIRQNIENSTQFAIDMSNKGIEIIQVSGSSRSKSVIEAVKVQKKVIISESATSPSLSQFDDDDFLFRLAPSDIYQGQVLADIAINSGAQKATIVINEDDIFGTDLSTQFQLNFEQKGGQVIRIVKIPNNVETDFSAYLDDIYNSQPDVIMNAMLLPEFAANQINASVQFSFNGFYLFPDTIAGKPEFINNLTDLSLVQGARGTSSGFGLQENPEFEFFRNSFIKQFSLEPQTFNVTAYDYVMVAALAIEKAGNDFSTNSPSGEQIRDSLRAVMNPAGEKIGPSRIGEALTLIRNGQAINYSGAYSDTDWDVNGDVYGNVVYNIFQLDTQHGNFVNSGQIVVNIPEPQ